MSRHILPALLFVLLARPAQAQSLPIVTDVDWPSFRTQALGLLQGLQTLGSPLPADALRALRPLLAEKAPRDSAAAARAVQQALDRYCLIGVSINPESRVKAARGARPAELPHNKSAFVLVKVHNEAGVTHALSVTSEQAVRTGRDGVDRWVKLAVVNRKPFANKLSGQTLEYRVMELTAQQSGKREATLAFDVGQGTQDLGFRAEVPILFTVRAR